MTPLKSLYRYRTFKDIEDILVRNEVFFASPDKFNDPFDCKTSFSTGSYSKTDLINHLEKIRDWLPSEYKAIVRYEKMDDEKEQERVMAALVEARDESLRKINSGLGILCLSEVPDNILMWAHYCDGHRGAVVEFDKEGLESHFGYLRKVEYHEQLVTLREHNNAGAADNARLFLLRKSDHWKYEKEWRIIRSLGNQYEKLPIDILKGIILGCEMRREDKTKIREWVKNLNSTIRVSQAVKSTSLYSINIVPLAEDD